ncbi:MAG: hypothetical protein KAQ98_10180 [Bacteriovoracaceae bacterium]|nr:hypothetical protein [Bacteriovoracaceae bacterium]
MRILTILTCLMFFSLSLNAEETPFCRDLLAQENNKNKLYLWQSLKLAIFPGSLFKPKFNKIAPVSEKQFSDYENSDGTLVDKNSLKNVILVFDSLNPGFSEEEESQLDQFKEDAQIIKKKMKRLKRSLKKRCIEDIHTSSHNGMCIRFENESTRKSRCYTLEKSLDLNHEDFYKKYNNLNFEIFKYKQQITANFYSKVFKKKLRKLKNKWTVIYGVNHNTFEKYISSNQIENIIIIGHSNQNHALVDTDKFSLTPRYFLKNISPTIRSIAIFSCESNKVENNYKLSHRLKNTPSIWEKRYSITTKDKNIFGRGNIVSPLGLSSFLKRVDKFLHHEKKKFHTHQEIKLYQKKHCSIRLTGVSSNSKNPVFATLNGNYIVTIPLKDNVDSILLKFNCNILNKYNDNVLLVKTASSDHSNPLKNIFATLRTPIELFTIPSYPKSTRRYKDQNRYITRMKFSF